MDEEAVIFLFSISAIPQNVHVFEVALQLLLFGNAPSSVKIQILSFSNFEKSFLQKSTMKAHSI